MSARALLSLAYYDAKLRGDRLREAGFRQWSHRARNAESLDMSGLFRRLLSPEEALETLRRQPHEHPEVEAGIVGGCLWSSAPRRGGDSRRHQQFAAHLTRIATVPKAVPGTVSGAVDRNDFVQACGLDIEYAADTGVDLHGVTSVGASGKRRKTTQSLDYYAELADPQKWSDNFGSTFLKSYKVALPLASPVRTPPPVPNPPKPGTTWHGDLFECAALQITPGDNLTKFRDILWIKFAVTPPPPRPSGAGHRGRGKAGAAGSRRKIGPPKARVTLEYGLNRCMTSSVVGIENRGGLDVDSGHGGVVLTLTKAGTGRAIEVDALKRVRFSRATAFSEVMNVIALPFLLVWIPYLIIDTLKR